MRPADTTPAVASTGQRLDTSKPKPACQGSTHVRSTALHDHRLRSGKSFLSSRRSSRSLVFAELLAELSGPNIRKLKDRAFVANRLAKLTSGRSRRQCYAVKHAAISALVSLGVASLSTQAHARLDPIIGIRFSSGGRLHAVSSLLAVSAREILAEHIAVPDAARKASVSLGGVA